MLDHLAERKAIIDKLRPKILAYGLPIEDVQEVLTRLAITEISVLREIAAKGMDEVAAALTSGRREG